MKKNTNDNNVQQKVILGKRYKLSKKDIAIKAVWIFFTSLLIAFSIKLSNTFATGNYPELLDYRTFLQIVLIASIMFIMLATIEVYIMFTNKTYTISESKIVPVLCVSSFISFLCCTIFGNIVDTDVIPLLLSSMLIAILIDKRAGIMSSILFGEAFFITFTLVFGMDKVINSAAGVITSIISSIFIILFMDRAKTRLKFISLSIIVSIVTAIIPFLVCIITIKDLSVFINAGLASLWAVISTLISIAIFMIILPFFEKVFGINTMFRISEICSIDFPLLRRLSSEAPGTFNHSLAVGNLAELCALAIGEDTQLAKASAYYHDVGKLDRPDCFIENQNGGHNPHDDFIPEVSVSIITGHTASGYKKIKEAGLPDVIADVAREHHGTTSVGYFLYKASKLTEDKLDTDDYRYQDPLPSTKISAIIMICDTIEAATRANGVSNDEDETRKYVHNLIRGKYDSGQFANCDITFKDLQAIEDTLVKTLPNMFHQRIKYENK